MHLAQVPDLSWTCAAVIMLVGCSSPEPASPSTFVQQVDLESIVRAAAGDAVDVAPESISGSSQSRELNKGANATAEIAIAFHCEPDSLDEFSTSIVEGLHQDMLAKGVSSDASVPARHDWQDGPWSLKYTQGGAQGTVRLEIAETPTTDYPHQLQITVEESTAD